MCTRWMRVYVAPLFVCFIVDESEVNAILYVYTLAILPYHVPFILFSSWTSCIVTNCRAHAAHSLSTREKKSPHFCAAHRYAHKKRQHPGPFGLAHTHRARLIVSQRRLFMNEIIMGCRCFFSLVSIHTQTIFVVFFRFVRSSPALVSHVVRVRSLAHTHAGSSFKKLINLSKHMCIFQARSYTRR